MMNRAAAKVANQDEALVSIEGDGVPHRESRSDGVTKTSSALSLLLIADVNQITGRRAFKSAD